ncbi:hypothetical protein BZL30_2361 [Mycobacterium kansasii]|uniref:Uncharacterized protein n=1 Tax=Mycobacterium kansasii TaxID=1768 RepID=A0A1V3XIY4_MYCKA|nr:hypothetical protein BZL30_2361 [Mycobacterium kansasii]
MLPLKSEAEPMPVPATAIYSRFDGMVAWQTCINPPGPRSENIAVLASHIGYGHHPATVWAIADRLAQPRAAGPRSVRRRYCGRCFRPSTGLGSLLRCCWPR